ncbi:hypothetical protein AAU61_14120 [Desulfocarbo indianensis]|nr:hypothetical protein AAU61_14120 [Desulfocarbo indianensis]
MPENAAELFLLEAWVADNPGSRLFLKLAQAYQQAGRLEEAAQVLQRGLVMHPTMVEARQALAEVLKAMGQREKALDQLMAAASELCRHAGVFNGLADLWRDQGLESQAQEAKELGNALTRGLNGLCQGQAAPAPPAAGGKPPAGARMAPPAPAEPLEPPEPVSPRRGPEMLLERLRAMESAARRRVRG